MSGGRGGGNPPLTYEGAYDLTRTYLPRQVVVLSGVAYMALTKNTGVTPPDTTNWQPLGGSGGGSTGTLTYRGDWAAPTTYAPADAVTRAYSLYVALSASTGQDPLAGVVSVASASATINDNSGVMSLYQEFIPLSDMWVDSIVLTQHVNAAAGATARWGIATAIGANDSSITWLGATPGVISTPTSSTPIDFTVPLPAAVHLSGGAHYYLAGQGVGGAGINGIGFGSGAVTLSNIDSLLVFGYTVAGGAWSTRVRSQPFALKFSYWKKIAKGGNQDNVNTVGSSGGAVTLPDPEVAPVNRVTLTANCTFTFAKPAAGKSLTLTLQQDGTGSRTATWPATVKWPGGTAPTLTATAGKSDLFAFVSDDGGSWLGRVLGQNYA